MIRLLGYILLGLIVCSFLFVTVPPATLFVGLLEARLPGLTVRQSEGSALYGSASDVGLKSIRIENLSWRWHPLALITGRMNYRLLLSEPRLRLEGTVGTDPRGEIHINDLHGRLPLAKLVELIGPTPLVMTGDLVLNINTVRLGANGLPQAARGKIYLRDARSSFPRLELGNFGMTLTTKDQAIVGVIEDEEGPLELAGTLTLGSDGRYRFFARVGVRDKTKRELQGILSILGRPESDGRWNIKFSGALNARRVGSGKE